MRSLQDWLDWQSSVHPKEIDLGLERVFEVYQRMNLDGVASVVFTVAGTNGKGSSVALLESICLQTGIRVGAYTTPHVLRYNERIRIDGHAVSDAALVTAFEAIEDGSRHDIDHLLRVWDVGGIVDLRN